jgi:hypothetical protein
LGGTGQKKFATWVINHMEKWKKYFGFQF